MSTLAELQALAAQAVEESGIDYNESVKGGGGARLLPAGYAFGRLVEYIEFGNQPQEFGGKAKDPALEFTLGFALWGEGYSEADGSPYVIRTWNTAMSRDDRSRSYKQFKALNWTGTAKGYAQLLGAPILVKIVHVARSKSDLTIVSRIDQAGYLPPLDPVTRAPYGIPEAPDNLYRMFLWSNPTKAAWDSLFIDGTYDEGENKGKSRNRIQEQILGALDFQGSALQALLGGAPALVLPVSTPVQAASVPAQVVIPAQAVIPVTSPLVAQAVAPVVAPLQSAPVVMPLPTSTNLPAASATDVTTSPSSPVLPVLAAVPAIAPVLPV